MTGRDLLVVFALTVVLLIAAAVLAGIVATLVGP